MTDTHAQDIGHRGRDLDVQDKPLEFVGAVGPIGAVHRAD